MVERDDDHFDLDEEFVAESEEDSGYEKFIDPVGRRARPSAAAAAKRASEGIRRSFIGLLSRTMIRMASQNAGRAPQLFGQHRARQHMRPGHRAKCDQQISLLPQFVAMSVSRPDQEPRLAHPVVARVGRDGPPALPLSARGCGPGTRPRRAVCVRGRAGGVRLRDAVGHG